MNPTTEALEMCARNSIDLHRHAVTSPLNRTGIIVESPATLHGGDYDAEFVGAFSYMGGGNSSIVHVSSIGRFCAIATHVVTGAHEHPTTFLSPHPLFIGSPMFAKSSSLFRVLNHQEIAKAGLAHIAAMQHRTDKIRIGNDVWIGEGAFIRRGVTIGDGAVVAARSVVTRNVPPYAIVGGAPARIIRTRFEPAVIDELLRLQWWNYGLSALHQVDFTDIHQAIAMIDRNIASGRAEIYGAPLVKITSDGEASILHYDDAGLIEVESTLAARQEAPIPTG